MAIGKILKNLSEKTEEAKEVFEIAQNTFHRLQQSLRDMEKLAGEIKMMSKISVINSDAFGRRNTILTAFCDISGKNYMLMVTEFISDGDPCFMGHVVDSQEGVPAFSCDFYLEYKDKQELFDELLGEYAAWYFDL